LFTRIWENGSYQPSLFYSYDSRADFDLRFKRLCCPFHSKPLQYKKINNNKQVEGTIPQKLFSLQKKTHSHQDTCEVLLLLWITHRECLDEYQPILALAFSDSEIGYLAKTGIKLAMLLPSAGRIGMCHYAHLALNILIYHDKCSLIN
jgi:hypothetical protein